MKNQLKLVFLFLLLLLSCRKDNLNKTLDFGQFTMEVPANWKSFTSQGYDSTVGGITNGKEKLTYDYGWYAYDFKNETAATHTRTSITIDGKPALLVKPKEKGKGVIGIFVQVDSQNKFHLSGQDIQDEDTVINIFKSVRF